MRPLYAHPILRGISARRLAHHTPISSCRHTVPLLSPRGSLAPSSLSPSAPATPVRMASSLSSLSSSSSSSTTTTVRFSAGSDESALSQALETLLGSAAAGGGGSGGGRWALTAGGEGLERSFRFKTFAKTWDFMTAVSLQCKIKNHHPEWSNVYNTTYIRWTTHNPRGLSAKDVELAAVCDSLARDFGEIVEEDSGASSSGGSSCEMKQLADRGAATAGDCCGPKK